MSTKSTIAYGNIWYLEEEMIDDTVWAGTYGMSFDASSGHVRMLLPPGLIDAIRAVPANAFPHLRAKMKTKRNGSASNEEARREQM